MSSPAPSSPPRASGDDRPGLALFDFDGTLTRRDTVLPFLLEICGTTALPRFTTAAGRALVAEPARRRDAAKAAIIRAALEGRHERDIAEAGRRYARTIMQRALRPHGRARLEWHRARGDRLVIVSASLEPYLAVVSEHLGVDVCLCTQLEVEDGIFTGAMAGANCRGTEKARRVSEVIDTSEYEVWAYGDTAGDQALLALADHPVWIGNRARRAVRNATNSPS